jgi:NAD(P)-dependent dehydrogenase (short-subunit alcohol dehydrogenase family)
MKHVVVTGGARGIGKTIVEELAAHGYEVTAICHESTKAADAVAAVHKNVRYVRVDLQDREAVAKAIEELLQGDPIDVLINNAGIYVGKRFEKMTSAELFQQIDLNLAAPAQLAHELLPSLKQAKAPLIINVSSQAVHARLTGEAMYTAVKAALSNLSFVLRAELNPEGVRVTTVEPYAVNTYGIPEPSNMILPEELARSIRSIIEMPDHLQVDTFGLSHIKQNRPDYPDWIDK